VATATHNLRLKENRWGNQMVVVAQPCPIGGGDQVRQVAAGEDGRIVLMLVDG